MKLNSHGAAFIFSVVDDTDIFDVDGMHGKERCDRCQHTGLIGNIHMDGVYFFDRTAGNIDKGFPVVPGGGKKVVKCLAS